MRTKLKSGSIKTVDQRFRYQRNQKSNERELRLSELRIQNRSEKTIPSSRSENGANRKRKRERETKQSEGTSIIQSERSENGP